MTSASGDLIDEFVKVFRGRGDCYGSWDGRCVKEELTPAVFRDHLHASVPDRWIGVYPNLGDQVSWGCVDIDGGDFPAEGALQQPDYDRKSPEWHDWDAMFTLARTLPGSVDIHGHIERTRNGYHVWVFPQDPLVSAKTMRRALMAACHVVDYDPKEVNPKQEKLADGKVGNYVRLPYYGAISDELRERRQTDRFFILDTGEVISLRGFLAYYRRTSTKALEHAASMWTPPANEIDHDVDAGLEAEPLLPLLDGLAYTIWKDGPLPGKDRSSTLAHLAHLCSERGMTAQQAFTIVKSADARHGRKFVDRPDGDEHITNLVLNAYGVNA